MPQHQEKAPSGPWRMPNDDIAAALGHFVMGWSGLEGAIEASISKQLGLAALEGSMVTSGMQFRGKANLLLSLLHRAPLKNRKAIETVKAMLSLGDRNDILHSIVGGAEGMIWFNRRKTDVKFTSKIEKYGRERFHQAALRCAALATDLMHALAISKADYEAFFQTAHNRANNV